MSSVLLQVAFFLIGSVAIVRGVALISPPAAWVVCGLGCVFVALWPALRARLLR